jgi:hypothetical protein
LPRAGSYEYPLHDLDKVVERLRIAHDKTKSLSVTRDTFAEALNYSQKTGPFGTLVGAMGHYGLITTGDGYIRYTDLCKQILFGNPQEVSEAKSKAVRNVKLFGDMFDRLEGDPTEDQIRLFLKERASVDISLASSLSLEIGKIFKKVSRYIKDMNSSEIEIDPKQLQDESTIVVRPATISERETFASSEDFGIWVRKDVSSIDYLMDQLDSVEKWLQHMKKKYVTVTTFPVVTDDAKGNEENST